MARNFLLGTLVTRCKERADLVNSSFVGDTEWKGYISTAYAQLQSILVASGLRYFERVMQLQPADFTDNGDNGGRVNLPTDFLSAIGIDRISGNQRQELFEMMVQERNLYASGTNSGLSEAYVLAGDNLILYPRPTSGNYELGYVTQPTDLSSQSDVYTVDVVTPDGEDYLIWTAAMFALTKEESDTAVCERYREQARQRVEEWSVRRSLNTARRRIVDEGPYSYDPADWRYR